MLISLAVRAILLLGVLSTSLSFGGATPSASPTAVVGCTVWRTGSASDATAHPDCTLSAPWWTAWSDCDVTPVHSERALISLAADQGLSIVPWVDPATVGMTIIGYQYYGNRPLHTDGIFPDGSKAKVLWKSDQPITGLTLIARDLSDSSKSPVPMHDVGVSNTATAYGTDWPSYINIPTPGCWRLDLRAQTQEGVEVTGSVTYIVIE